MHHYSWFHKKLRSEDSNWFSPLIQSLRFAYSPKSKSYILCSSKALRSLQFWNQKFGSLVSILLIFQFKIYQIYNFNPNNYRNTNKLRICVLQYALQYKIWDRHFPTSAIFGFEDKEDPQPSGRVNPGWRTIKISSSLICHSLNHFLFIYS